MTSSSRVAGPLRGDTAILSPHLDDAVYSLGAAIREGVRAGAHITVVTVFAGNPSSRRPASAWDRRFGFGSAGEAARVRREEDRRACALLGATPIWLPFDDEEGEPTPADELWDAINGVVGEVDVVLAPGYPLTHEDHLRLTRIVLARQLEGPRLGLYVEQPYAAVRKEAPSVVSPIASLVDGEPEWHALTTRVAARLGKVRAWRAYRSQSRHFGYRTLANVMRYETRYGGEMVGCLRGARFGSSAE